MTNKFIVDTNVWVRGSQVTQGGLSDPCTKACFEFLQMIEETGATVVFDMASIEGAEVPGNTVLQELNRNLSPQDYAYDLFWKNIFYGEGRIEFVSLQYDEEGALYPEGMTIHQVEDDGTERPFEPNDRKWIALHAFHEEHPPIYNALDGDWHKARRDLEKHGIVVKQLCPWMWSS